MAEHVRITVAIHDRQDPACVKHDGTRAPWGLRWLFRCDTCRRDRADAEERGRVTWTADTTS